MEENKEQVNHPSHYMALGIEVLDIMECIWGIDDLITYCRMNSLKYRLRAGHKDDAMQDIQKALFYEDYAQKLQEKRKRA